ncbi:MAG: HlyC/CorC family transporter [Thermoplasmatales archaeon]|nr:HlyC/CorC family transporter [Thermoplasmatales archaeon]
MLWWVLIILICILLALSSFFSAAEMAFVSVDRIRIRGEAIKNNKKAILLEKLLEKPEEVINSITICNNIVNVTASVIGGVISANFFGSIGIGLITALMTFSVIVFGEALPKAFGVNNYKFAIKIANYLYLIRKIFYPIAKILYSFSKIVLKLVKKDEEKSRVDEEEIKIMLDIGVKNGTIEKDEKKLIEEIFDFNDTKVKEICIPPEKMVCVSENETVESFLKKFLRTGYSRFPVYGKNKDDIIGMVHVKDAIYASSIDKNMKIRQIARNIIKVDPSMNADDILREMQRRKTHMAVIKSIDGRILGLVTMEDLIEEIFGDIKDEHDLG